MRPFGAVQVLYLIPSLIARGTFNLLTLFSYVSLAKVSGAVNYLDFNLFVVKELSYLSYLIAEDEKPLCKS